MQGDFLLRCASCPFQTAKVVEGEWILRYTVQDGVQTPKGCIAIVGIAPWKTEAKEGHPFVGDSGKLIRPWIEARLRDYAVWITNGVSCVCLKPTRDQLKACQPRIVEELRRIKPDGVLILGADPRKMLKDEPYPMAWTDHPSVVVRKLQPESRWRDGLNAAWARLQVAMSGQKETPIQITSQEGVWALDCEYKGPAHNGFDLCVLTSGSEDLVFWSDREGDTAKLQDALSRVGTLVTHHGVNELVALAGRGVEVPAGITVQDTMTAQGILRPGSSRDLGTMANLKGWTYPFMDIQAWKSGKVPNEVAEAYCLNDAKAALGIWEQDGPWALQHPLYADTYQPLIRVLASMASIPIDRERVELLIAEHEKVLMDPDEGLEAKLAQVASINWYSPKQVGEYLTSVGVNLPKTDQGNPSSDENALIDVKTDPDLEAGVVETIDLVLSLRGHAKILSTYLYRWLKDGAARTIYDPTGARTGRMASRDSNMQNIPKALRQCLIAPYGWQWVGCDFNQAEFAMAAWLSGDENMIADVESGDFHTAFGTILLGHTPNKEERRDVKPSSFGLVYLGSDRTLMNNMLRQLGVIMERKVAQMHVAIFWDRYKGYLSYVERLRAEAAKSQVISPFGRRYPWKKPKSIDDMRSLVNTLNQGATGDLTARALLRVSKLGMPCLTVVHDYISAACPMDKAEEYGKAMMATMVDDKIPFIRAELEVLPRWELGEVDAEEGQ